MSIPIELINAEIETVQEQLDIDIKKVSLLQQEIKEIKERANTSINEKQTLINNATQPIIENQGALKKLKELKNKQEAKMKTASEK
tara:strand:- start:1361 stop:1618 length:258 start_codon:yes stop_codon:yes gene_type:complete